ncbi:MAG: carboxypeptidase regulatory-like domain-containing protein [Longimicrobiales bacterium]
MRTALLCVLLSLAPVSLSAQTAVSGEAVAEDTGTPLAGALVELEDSTGVVVSGLSGSRGRFFLRASGPGRYRISVGALGYRTVRTDWFEVAADAVVTRRVEVPLEPVGLTGIRVSTRRRCGTDAGTGDLARVWAEARKGLTAVALTDSLALNYRLEFLERALDREWGTVLAETSSQRWAHAVEPFRSAAVDDLLEGGFIQEVGDTTAYYGPDARLLLSAAFLDHYCFALVRGEPGELGLKFTPVRRVRQLSQIEGVIWLDEATAEPRRLTFTYLNPPLYTDRFEVGGEVEYQRLPTGAWIVRRWLIRTPQPMTSRLGVPTRSVGYVRESSGEVIAVSGPEFELQLGDPPGTVAGRVLAQEDDGPLGNVLVYLNGTTYADTTGPGGSFRLTDVRPGRYHLAAYHSQLGEEPAAVAPVEVAAGEDTAAVLRVAVPAVVEAGCPFGSGSVIRGRVIEPSTGTPLPDAIVEMRPEPGEGVAADGAARAAAQRTRASSDGVYRFCGVPEGPTRLIAHLPWTAPVRTKLNVSADTVLDVDLNLALDVSADAPGRIVGRVVEVGTDRPLEGATVEVAGAKVVSNEAGGFVVGDVAPGEVPVRATLLGYADADGTVELSGGQTAEMEIRLSTRPIEVEPITVTVRAEPLSGPIAGFNDRLESGRGTFILADEIERRNPIRLTQILQAHHLRVEQNGRQLVNPRQNCAPMVYLDGVRATYIRDRTLTAALREAADAVNMVHPSSVAGIEVYRGAAELPAMFSGRYASCGAIGIWTKRHSGGAGDRGPGGSTPH